MNLTVCKLTLSILGLNGVGCKLNEEGLESEHGKHSQHKNKISQNKLNQAYFGLILAYVGLNS